MFFSLGFSQTTITENITNNTVWSIEESPFEFANDISIAPNIELLVEPGVILNGNNYAITVFGDFNCKGDSSAKIQVNNLEIAPGNNAQDAPFKIHLDHSLIEGGDIYSPNGNAIYGSIDILNSKIKDIGYMYIWYPVDTCRISKNIFEDTGGITIGTSEGVVYIENNLFINSIYNGEGTPSTITNWASYNGDSATVVRYNSFIDTTNVAVKLQYQNSHMVAKNNYWNTTNEATIE